MMGYCRLPRTSFLKFSEVSAVAVYHYLFYVVISSRKGLVKFATSNEKLCSQLDREANQLPERIAFKHFSSPPVSSSFFLCLCASSPILQGVKCHFVFDSSAPPILISAFLSRK